METWVDDILRDAEIVTLQHNFFKKEKIRPTVRYGIDRETLKHLGVTDLNANRLYKALFVYSVGFYELLQTITSTVRNKDKSTHSKIIGGIWTVYSILLEFCCKSDYKLLISQLSVEHEDQKQILKDMIETNNERFMERENDMKDQFKNIQKDYDELLEERIYYKKYTDKLNDIIDDLRGKIEEETKIRKVFENKLNDLHSIVRDKEARYTRSKIDIDHLLEDSIQKNKAFEALQEEFSEATKMGTAYQIKFDSINQLLVSTRKELENEKGIRYKEEAFLSGKNSKFHNNYWISENEGRDDSGQETTHEYNS